MENPIIDLDNFSTEEAEEKLRTKFIEIMLKEKGRGFEKTRKDLNEGIKKAFGKEPLFIQIGGKSHAVCEHKGVPLKFFF